MSASAPPASAARRARQPCANDWRGPSGGRLTREETHGTPDLRPSSMAARKCCEYEAYDVPAPGPGEALVRHAAIGLNFIDVYLRTGLYPAPLPLTPGHGGRRHRSRRSALASPTSHPASGSPMPARPIGRLCRPARDAGRNPGAAARCDLVRHRGRDDAQGHDRAISAAPDLSGAARRPDPVPCRRRRGRADRRPVGQASGCGRHRHRQLAGQGRTRPRAWLRARHRLFARGLRRPRQRAHRRRGRAGRL